jgi:coproporphyrinogen III oxidase
MVDGGAVIATGNVTAWYDHVAGGSSRSAGILVDLRTASSALPSLRAALRYDGVGEDPLHPVDEWFTGKVLLVGSLLRAKDVEHFDRAWEAVCDRHPAAGAYQGLRCEGGFAFGPLRGDPEGAFHFMRAVGRALGSAYFSILREER